MTLPTSYDGFVRWLHGRPLWRPRPATAVVTVDADGRAFTHSAWTVPTMTYAWCPMCHTDGALVVEPYGKHDRRAVLFCTNEGRCPSWHGATTDTHIHNALWAYLEHLNEKEAAA